jgi:hypothetical protein
LWPADAVARAVARSVSAETHAGFGALRDYYEIVFSRHGWRARLKACNVECKI